jgi:Beta-1,3-glucanase
VTGSPTISTQPADQTVVVGQHALFNVVAAGATTYQWCQNGNAINGATSATYYSGALAAGDATDSFTVVVGNSAGTVVSKAAVVHINPNTDGSPPASFWGNTAALPAATQTMTFSFVNATNGVYPDSQVFWSFSGKTNTGATVTETHSIADAPTYDMPAVSSARMYFYIAPSQTDIGQGNTNYYDFIEFNIGRSSASVPWNFNGDTTRVDAFGLKTAIHLHCNDSTTSPTDVQRGEDYGTFLEDRSITFLKYQAETPAEFLGTLGSAPYRITQPGSAGDGFLTGEANATYYNAYITQVWTANNIDVTQVPEPTPFLNFVSNQQPDLSAAMERHVAQNPNTFNASGKLVNGNFWSTIPSSDFYSEGPANFYAKYWHTHGIAGKAYGFPYDDVGGYSSDISCNSPQWLVVAIGW